jgi:hypothetical protein
MAITAARNPINNSAKITKTIILGNKTQAKIRVAITYPILHLMYVGHFLIFSSIIVSKKIFNNRNQT